MTPLLRRFVSSNLHPEHLSIDELKCLTHRWTGIDVDIARFYKVLTVACTKYLTGFRNEFHVLYYVAFGKECRILFVVGSYSHWPDMYFTTSSSIKFIIAAMRKAVDHQDAPQTLVTDNENDFIAERITSGLKAVRWRHSSTSPRYP